MMRYELLRDLPGIPAGTLGHYKPKVFDRGDTPGYQFGTKWYDTRELERYPDWFRPIPEEPPIPEPIYPSDRGNSWVMNLYGDDGVQHQFRFALYDTQPMLRDVFRFAALVEALYVVFRNRRNVECGSVPFGGSVAYVDHDPINGKFGVHEMDNRTHNFELGAVWPTREMATAEAQFKQLLFKVK